MKKLKKTKGSEDLKDSTVVEFLPDADEIERSSMPFLIRFTLYVLVFAFTGFILWAVYSDVDKVVVAKGKLVNTTSNIIVQPLETSIIQKVNVRPGQVVKKGELLASLDPTFAEADKEQLRTKLDSLETQAKRLEAELSGKEELEKQDANTDSQLQTQLSAEREANLKAQLRKLEASVQGLRSAMQTNLRDQQLMNSRVQVLREMETMQEKLVAQQSVARASLLEARERRLQVERELQLARNRAVEMKSELASLLAEKEAFSRNWSQKTMEELLAVSRERDALREQLQKADKRRELVVLTSPADAVVLQVAKFSPGSIILAAETLFTLVPLGSTLEAEVDINSMDIGYIKRGAEVRLKFDAFPFQRHGTINGKVRTISEDAFQGNPAEGKNPGAYYLGRVSMGRERLKKMSNEARLLPGMTLVAEIVIGKRSVISYLLWPLAKALEHADKEKEKDS